jgi:pimeloyl-ACP methyl ester carboxylesterase
MEHALSGMPVALRRTRWQQIGRIGGSVVLALVMLIGVGWVAGAVAKERLRAAFPPPGRLVDVGGYRMHIHCQGTGSPTVVLEAGQGESSLTWAGIHATLAQRGRVCAYDRAGYGWSERSPLSRTAANMVSELHMLLTNAHIPGPYVLVGHSIGGLNARLFAQRYPAEVAGMVLVDPAHEEMVSRLPEAYQAAVRDMQAQAVRDLQMPTLLSDAGLLALFPALTGADTRLPPDAQASIRALMAIDNRFFLTVADELQADAQSQAELRASRMGSLGDMPLVVLKADAPAEANAETTGDLPPWTPPDDLHARVAALSTRGELVLAPSSGHYIHYDQPDLVLDTVQRVLAAVTFEQGE